MKPNKLEDEYVWVQEMKQRMANLAKDQQAKSQAEKQQLKDTHWMHCPKCGQKLASETCGAVEIDVCPSCKGVWLDMGELGAIVEGAGQGSFFHKCLRIIRKESHPSPRLSPHLATRAKSPRSG